MADFVQQEECYLYSLGALRFGLQVENGIDTGPLPATFHDLMFRLCLGIKVRTDFVLTPQFSTEACGK
ncbi:hypothetical protein TorRG33x02_161980 [Trema orientale]|uniref:Uncharacterized protein n=1 Tax=Trema orientale TaxID=63057 RepID=A0A2P5ER41_TREOI|nr:hypothetical protein TorRG33x02_161980 [Trema orientale]